MTQKQLVNLQINPGVYTEQTERGAVGQWYRADKVRFRKGLAEKIGGWVRLDSTNHLGVCRRLKDWSSLDSKKWLAIATDVKLYVWNDDNLYDITPIRDSGELTNPFATTISSSTVTVTHNNHRAQVGDYVRFTGASLVGGITVDGEYRVQTVPSINTYTITDDETATATANGGGTVAYEYDINAGDVNVVAATGYGAGPYGREGYGNARTGSTLRLGIRTWQLDTWGEDLLASPRKNAIYWWDRSKGTGTRAVPLGGDAPPTCEAMLVSQRDRHVLALGAYDYFNEADDPMLIRWCSTEDLNDWVPTSENTSGDLRIYSGSRIITGVRSRLETVIFTDISVHTLPFVGGFDVFGLNIVGENVSILSANAAIPVDHRVFFMAEADFYVYDGVVRTVPSTVRNFVYDNLNLDQATKIAGGLNREFNEVWWFYPSFDPDSWVQQDFSLGLPTGYTTAEASGAGVIGYSYSFNSNGWTQITNTADNGYEYDYVLFNDEPILDHDQSEYAVEFAFHPDGNGIASRWGGLVFLRTEITGTPDNTDDDAQGIYVECDIFTDTIRVRKKNASGVKSAMVNDPGTTTFNTLLGAPAATDQKYIITAQVSGVQITIWVDGVQAFQFDLDGTLEPPTSEVGLYLVPEAGSAGFHAEPAATIEDEFKFYNFAVGPVGVLTDIDFDISPIEVNRYVAYNYEEQHWTVGRLSRTAWADRSPLLEKAYAANTDGYLYKHETGTDANGTAMGAFIESYDMEIPNAGEELMHVDQLIPDFLELEGSIDLTLSGKKYPQDANRITKGPYTVSNGTSKVSTRIRARQIAIRVESSQTGAKWRMGTLRGRVGAHGKRG